MDAQDQVDTLKIAAAPTEAGVVADLATTAALQPRIIKDQDGGEHLLIPQGGGEMMSIALLRADFAEVPPPAAIAQAVTVQTTDSLVDYVNRFKTDYTVLFADIMANSITAVVDYHEPRQAARLKHSAVLALPFSEEWRTWEGRSGKLGDMLSFARFIEENAVDVIAPAGADLLEICRDLQAVRNVDFRRAVRTSIEAENFEYAVDETLKGGGPGKEVEVPTKFQLKIPVYFGGAPTELYAFLRFKLEPPQLALGIELHRAEHVRQAVFKQIVLEVAAQTDRPVVFGRPN